jgi:hypothetical protein
MTGSNRLSREQACATLGLTQEIFARIEQADDLAPEADGLYDAMRIATAAVRFGLGRGDIADRKIASVASALTAVRPALERLADLPARAGLEGEAHHRAMVEVATFFTAFADAMNSASAVLADDEEPAGRAS